MNSSNTALRVIRIVVWVFLAATAVISSTHIVDSGQRLGLGWESWTLPMFIDGIALVGKLSMLPRFSASFRKSGFRLLMVGGVLSLAANIYAGHNLGQRAFGVIVVVGFMLLESHATKADRTAIAPAPAEVVDEVKAKRRAAALKGAATRKANRSKATKTTRRPRVAAPRTPVQEIEDLEDVAPVSPAMV